MEIAFTPWSVLRPLRTQSLFLQVCPEPVNVGNVEDQPPPLGNRITRFEIENRVLSVLRAERREICIFAAVDDLQAQKISMEPHGGRHTGHLKGNCGKLFNGSFRFDEQGDEDRLAIESHRQVAICGSEVATFVQELSEVDD